jgi:SAM-dependent methyltransferase
MFESIIKKSLAGVPQKWRKKAGYFLLKDILPIELEPRFILARKFLRGNGIEIGALHMPMPLPENAQVQYVDRMTVDALRKQYPELSNLPLVEADIVDDGEKLFSIKDESCDFLIAAHMIEHTQDPIGTLKNWLRVLRNAGVIYLAVPHKAFTFDKNRPDTTLEHLQKDYEDGPADSRREHFDEWVDLVDNTPEHERGDRIIKLMALDYSIHYHVWDSNSFLEFLCFCARKVGLRFTIEDFQLNGHEMLVVLRKASEKD